MPGMDNESPNRDRDGSGRADEELALAAAVFAFDGGLLLDDEQRGRAAARLRLALDAFEGRMASDPAGAA